MVLKRYTSTASHWIPLIIQYSKYNITEKQTDKIFKTLHNCAKSIDYCNIKIIIQIVFRAILNGEKINKKTKKTQCDSEKCPSPPYRNDDMYILLRPEPDVPSLLVLRESLFFFRRILFTLLLCSNSRQKSHTYTI